MPLGGARRLDRIARAGQLTVMNAELIETADEHRWELRDFRVTQLHVDLSSFRVETWTLEGSLEIRLSVPFHYREADGHDRRIDPEEPERLAPLLSILGSYITTIVVARSGNLLVQLADGSEIQAASHPRFEAWELTGGGTLEGISYQASPGRGSPWGA